MAVLQDRELQAVQAIQVVQAVQEPEQEQAEQLVQQLPENQASEEEQEFLMQAFEQPLSPEEQAIIQALQEEQSLAEQTLRISNFTPVQLAMYNELRFDMDQAERFGNEYQVIGYIAARDVEVALSFGSINGIVEYYRNHPQDLLDGMGRLAFRVAADQAMVGMGVPTNLDGISIYPRLLEDLYFCLYTLYDRNSNNSTSSTVDGLNNDLNHDPNSGFPGGGGGKFFDHHDVS